MQQTANQLNEVDKQQRAQIINPCRSFRLIDLSCGDVDDVLDLLQARGLFLLRNSLMLQDVVILRRVGSSDFVEFMGVMLYGSLLLRFWSGLIECMPLHVLVYEHL